MNELCHCGEPLHYSDADTEKMMRKLVSEKGRFINVQAALTGITYKVDRHYIALHGLKGCDLETSGFEIIKENDK
jgi:hypothetical protein